MGGFPGAGKTEIATYMSRETGYTVLDKDTTARPLVEKLTSLLTGNPHDVESPEYVKEVRPLEYKTLMSAAWSNLNTGKDVICAAPFLHELPNTRWISSLKQQCLENDVVLKTMWVFSDEEVLKQRIVARQAPRDTWKIQNWEKYSTRALKFPTPQVDWAIYNNGNVSIEQLGEEMVRVLSATGEYDDAQLQALQLSGKINPINKFMTNPNPTMEDSLGEALSDPYDDTFIENTYDELTKHETSASPTIYAPNGEEYVKTVTPLLPYIQRAS